MIEGAGGVEVPKALFYAIILFCTHRSTAALKRPACFAGAGPESASGGELPKCVPIYNRRNTCRSGIRSQVRPAGKGYRQ